MPQTNHGSIEFLKFPNPQYPGDNTRLIKKWLRDSWARRKIAALQTTVATQAQTIASLQSTVTAQGQTIASLQSSVASLDARVTTLEGGSTS